MINDEYSNLFTSKRSKSSEIGQIEVNNKYGWLALIDRLSNGDITRHDAVYDMNYVYCLNVLGYWYERDKVIEQENKRAELKNKH